MFHNTKRLHLIWLVGIMILCGGCGGKMPAVVEVAEENINSSVYPIVSATRTLTVTPLTATPSPIITVEETVYLTPTLPIKTMEAVNTLEAITVQKPELESFFQYIEACVFPPYSCVVEGLGLSPDGKWAVFFLGESIYLYAVDGSGEWTIGFSDLTGSLGAGTVSVVFWSGDGNTVYLVPKQDGADGGTEWYWGWKNNKLIRFDLNSGDWEDTGMGYAYSFSADGQFVAYREGQTIRVRQLITKSEMSFPIPYDDFGHFIWSPDNSSIVFAASKSGFDYGFSEDGFATCLLDVNSGELDVLIPENEEYFYPIAWEKENTILFDVLFGGYGTRFEFDLDLKEMKTIQD